MFKIDSTYKARDVEEGLDIIFYRPFGYFLAVAAKSVKMTPNMVTFLGTLVGVIAGHLFYYNYFTFDVIGIVLLIFSEALDSADGQLARMTQKYSKVGRILDGLATGFIFLSIYIHLCLRLINGGVSDSIFLIAVACVLSHSIQSAIADFYRNIYLMIVHDKGEFETFEKLNEKYLKLSWKESFFEKLVQKFYLNYTKQQESLTKTTLNLLSNLKLKYGDNATPLWFKDEYKKTMYPLLKYYNILTTNTRLICLFVAVLLNDIRIYFFFEIVVLNILLAFVLSHQNKLSNHLNCLIISLEK